MRTLGAAATLALGLLLGALPASAHGDKGLLAVEAGSTAGPGAVVITARLSYANDAERATGATVTAQADGPDARTVAPIPLTGGANGVYSGSITLASPGEWTVTVTAAQPAATGRLVVTVPDPATTTQPAPTSARTTTTVTSDASGDGQTMFFTAGATIIGLGLFAAWLARRAVKRSNT